MLRLASSASYPGRDDDLAYTMLDNGVRVFALETPGVETAHVSVFVRTGSRDESRRLNGISHVVEHMAFKGTRSRTCQQINLDAERLGADVNAHTDKDHTAYHMRGLAKDAARFVEMLADIVQHSTFPDEELERERNVIVQEMIEEEDDPLATADKLFDKLSLGSHPLAQPVIGLRGNIRRFSRDDLLDYTARQYSGANLVVGIAGGVDAGAVIAAAEGAFASLRRGEAHTIDAPVYRGGVASRAQAGSAQTHVLMGYPIPSLVEGPAPAMVAATVFGEGMSSPLMDRIRERRGLVYYASCAAEQSDVWGQFVIEASTSPEHLDEFFREVRGLLDGHARAIDPVDFERARNQLRVRALRAFEAPGRRVEEAATGLFVHGRIRSPAELAAELDAVGIEDARRAFEAMLESAPTAAIAGKVPLGASERAARVLGARAAE